MEHLAKLLISLHFLTLYSPSLPAEEHDICSSRSDQTGIIDTTYHYLNTKFCQPAIWFDSFFVDERSKEDARAGTMVRWYNDLSWSKYPGFGYQSKLSAQLHLPKITHRLKLVFESGEEDDLPTILPSNRKETQNELGLRYDKYGKRHGSFTIKVTFTPSIETRYSYRHPFTTQTAGRFTQKLYQNKQLTGESSQVDLDHSISPKFLLRWTNYAKFETDIDGFKMGSGFTLYHYISPKQAISYKASISGPDEPYYYINNSHLSITYRHNILRKWFFYEVTPEINWNKTFATERKKETTITLRFEVLFKNL